MRFFVIMDVIGLLFAIALLIVDKRRDGLLCRASGQKKQEPSTINTDA
jgi:hypothetical protein